MVAEGHLTNKKRYKFIFPWPVACGWCDFVGGSSMSEGRLIIRSHTSNHKVAYLFTSIMRLCEVMWQRNFVIYLFPRGLLLLNLTYWWLVIRSHYPENGRIFWSRDHEQSLDKSETFYLQSQKLYGQQTWQDINLWHGATIHHVTSTFDKVFMWGHLINLKP